MVQLVISASLLGMVTLTGIASTLFAHAMIDEVNRKKSDDCRIPYGGFPMTRIVREYKALYPKGIYAKAYLASVVLTFVAGFTLMYLFCVVLVGSSAL